MCVYMCIWICVCTFYDVLHRQNRAFELYRQCFIRIEARITNFLIQRLKIIKYRKAEISLLDAHNFPSGQVLFINFLSVKQLIYFFFLMEISSIWSHLCSWDRFLFLSHLAAQEQTLLLQALSLSLTSLQSWPMGCKRLPGAQSPLLWREA